MEVPCSKARIGSVGWSFSFFLGSSLVLHSCYHCVHFVDLRLENLRSNIALQLEGARQHVVFDRAELTPEDELFGFLEARQLLFSS